MKIIIDENYVNKRIDVFLFNYIEASSRSKIQKEIKNGNVTVNSNLVKSSYLLKEDDVVEFNIIEYAKSYEIKPERIDLDIVWEDDNMLVVNKPSGMLTHPTTIETSGTLVNALLYHYADNLSDINGAFRRGIIHRLDRNTSGLLMVAKNNKAHEYLVSKMKQGRMVKKYRAIVKGVLQEDYLVIDSPIGRNPVHQNKMAIVPVENGGKESKSIVRTIHRYADATLIEVQLITGRTHQIRVHLSSINHPVYNDTLYGFGKVKVKTEEQVLQSYMLSFPKPFNGEMNTLEINQDEKFDKVLKFLES